MTIVHFENCKSNFLVLGEEPADGINGSVCKGEKNFSVVFRMYVICLLLVTVTKI